MQENKKIEDSNEISEEQQFDQIKESAWQGLKLFFKELLDLREETDQETTIESVKKDISIIADNIYEFAYEKLKEKYKRDFYPCEIEDA